MNRGVFQSSPVQPIMGGSPSWWNNMRPPPQQAVPFLPPSSSTSPGFPQYNSQQAAAWQENQDLPESWSQLLLGGLIGEEERCGTLTPLPAKKMESWEEQMLYQNMMGGNNMVCVKQEPSEKGYGYGHGNEEIPASLRSTWSQGLPVSSPRSCVTSLSCNVLDFSTSCCKLDGRRQQMDHSSECNSAANGTAAKKAKVQAAAAVSTHTTFKVRKEKLGDRITALHQLVSPFGKTDTASVLLEAIGYIRFLQSQIEALCSPYLGNGSGNMRQQQQQQQHLAHGESRSCIFPDDPGQLLNDACLKRKGSSTEKDAADQDGPKKDLRSRGLCLVPISCTLHVGNDTNNGADYWAPSLGAGAFR